MVTSLVGHAGETVTLEGSLVRGGYAPRLPWVVAGKTPVFVEVVQGNGLRLPIETHVADVPGCRTVRLTGKVIVARGYAASGSTVGAYAEPQLDVERWACRGGDR